MPQRQSAVPKHKTGSPAVPAAVGSAGTTMLKDNSGTGKVFRNASWLIACRIVQALLSFVIGTLTARYLGPSGYGVIDYANAIVSFMVPVVQLGIRSTLVHEIISAPEREGQVLGTSLCMSAGTSLLGIAGVAAFAGIANRGEKETVIVCVLYSISLLFQATEMLQYWFQAKLLSKYVAVTSLIAYAAVSAYRSFLLITGKNVYWFALSQALDLMLISVCLYFLYRRLSGQRLSVSMPLAGAILRRSRYYILSGIMVTFFSLTDRVMITLLLGKEANGFYSAAVTCADISRFVFAAIVDSARPAVLEAKKADSPDYGLRICRLYSVIVYLALAQGLVLTVGAPLIVRILYGKAYGAAVPTLRIIGWNTLFAYAGSVRNIWILAEQKQQLLWKINLAGAVLNIAANSLLIPLIGIEGAAAASVGAQALVNVALCFALPALRPVGKMLLQGINPCRLRRLWSR